MRENGNLDAELVGQRLAELRATSKRLHARRDELVTTLDAEPTTLLYDNKKPGTKIGTGPPVACVGDTGIEPVTSSV